MSTPIRTFVFGLAVYLAGMQAVPAQVPNAGFTKVTGEFAYKSAIVPKYFSQRATAALICVTDAITKPADDTWLPKSAQIIGRFVSPIETSPLKYEVSLPSVPECSAADLDNNGRKDQGVQLLAAINAIDLFGDSFLEQVEQESGFLSFLSDSRSNSIRKGTLLIYSGNNDQRVPSGAGPDKRLFTADDPMVRVPAGYSLMRIEEGGAISLNNSSPIQMDILQGEEGKNPDFSGEGLLQSFDSLIDLLKERYAYTELRKIEWEEKRAKFRPRFADADNRKDIQDFYIALYDLASSLKDGHVQTSSFDPSIAGKRRQMLAYRYGGKLGAQAIRYSDGRFIVISVGKGSAAEKAGFKVGTEILKINGKPTLEHIESLPPLGFYGTEERSIELSSRFLFSFPLGESVTVEYRQPGDSVPSTSVLTAGEFESGGGLPDVYSSEPIRLSKFGGEFGYFRWANFENAPLNIAGLETFLERSSTDKGIILDLRGNSGGLLSLMYAMASYFFTEKNAPSLSWLETWVYDDVQKKYLTSSKVSGRKIWSPRPQFTYEGPVVVLVDGASASAAEYFSQYMQRQKRAVVIADSGTDGAGGIVRMAIMPGNIPFTFTGGRTYFAGTREVNLEGKGVVPDIRVPIDDDYVRRRLNGEDVVLNAAISYLSRTTADK